MKKTIYFVIAIILLVTASEVQAISFTKNNYLDCYATGTKEGIKINYPLQVIKNNDGEPVYTIDPFKPFVGTDNYNIYEKDLTAYQELTDEQKEEISIIAHYGYDKKDRNSTSYYAAAQLLIWYVTVGEDNITYKDRIGTENLVSLYEEEINTITKDVLAYKTNRGIIKDYNSIYNNTIKVNNLPNDYIVKSSPFNYKLEKGILTISNINKSGTVTLVNSNSDYSNDVIIYDSTNNQDYIRAGKIKETIYKVNVNLISGRLALNLIPETALPSVESNINNSCFELLDNNIVVETICFNKDKILYENNNLPLKNYKLRQVSAGTGYKKETEPINIDLSSSKSNITYNINLKQIKNTIAIEKYYCDEIKCHKEPNAEFDIIDKNNNVVKTITTNEEGYASLEVAYGTYTVHQTKGIDNYPLIEPYSISVLTDEPLITKSMYSKYDSTTEIVDKKPSIPEEPKKEEENNETPDTDDNKDIIIPDTGIKTDNKIIKGASIATIILTISLLLKFHMKEK